MNKPKRFNGPELLENLCLQHEENDSETTFPQFGKLPEEIRKKIWEYAISERRIISLVARESRGIEDDIQYGRIPSFFFVNWESRQIALEMYLDRLTFSFTYCKSADPVTAGPSTVHPPHQGQLCVVRPDDIVTFRVEEEYYELWAENWAFWGKDDHWSTNIAPVRFPGHWKGDHHMVQNWMMMAPLNMFHMNPEGDTDLTDLGPRQCRDIIQWFQRQFFYFSYYHIGLTLGDSLSPPCNFQNVYCLVYGWQQPKKANLGAYDLVSIEKHLPELFTQAELARPTYAALKDVTVSNPTLLMVKGTKPSRWAPTVNLRPKKWDQNGDVLARLADTRWPFPDSQCDQYSDAGIRRFWTEILPSRKVARITHRILTGIQE